MTMTTCIKRCDNFKDNDKPDQTEVADKAGESHSHKLCLLMIPRRPKCLICSKPASRRRRLARPPWTLHHPPNANTIPSIRWSLRPSSRTKVQKWCYNCFLDFFFFYNDVPSHKSLLTTSVYFTDFNSINKSQSQLGLQGLVFILQLLHSFIFPCGFSFLPTSWLEVQFYLFAPLWRCRWCFIK